MSEKKFSHTNKQFIQENKDILPTPNNLSRIRKEAEKTYTYPSKVPWILLADINCMTTFPDKRKLSLRTCLGEQASKNPEEAVWNWLHKPYVLNADPKNMDAVLPFSEIHQIFLKVNIEYHNYDWFPFSNVTSGQITVRRIKLNTLKYVLSTHMFLLAKEWWKKSRKQGKIKHRLGKPLSYWIILASLKGTTRIIPPIYTAEDYVKIDHINGKEVKRPLKGAEIDEMERKIRKKRIAASLKIPPLVHLGYSYGSTAEDAFWCWLTTIETSDRRKFLYRELDMSLREIQKGNTYFNAEWFPFTMIADNSIVMMRIPNDPFYAVSVADMLYTIKKKLKVNKMEEEIKRTFY